MSNDLQAIIKCLHVFGSQLVKNLCPRPSDPHGLARAEAVWRRFRRDLLAAGNKLNDFPDPIASWIRRLGQSAKLLDELAQGKRIDSVVGRFDFALFESLMDEGGQLLKEYAPRRADPFAPFVGPSPTATAPPTPTAPTSTGTPPTAPPTPAKILVRWRDIVEALPLRETMPQSTYEERRRRLAYLNQRYGGPIQTRGKGSQPRVDLAELLDWWNALTLQVQHAIDRERDAAATLLDQHNYGRAGRVAPSIAGSIKARRQKTGH